MKFKDTFSQLSLIAQTMSPVQNNSIYLTLLLFYSRLFFLDGKYCFCYTRTLYLPKISLFVVHETRDDIISKCYCWWFCKRFLSTTSNWNLMCLPSARKEKVILKFVFFMRSLNLGNVPQLAYRGS
jgi:hypothetical protein